MSLSIFQNSKPIIGMIHVGALPGTPAHSQSVAEIIASAVAEAKMAAARTSDLAFMAGLHRGSQEGDGRPKHN